MSIAPFPRPRAAFARTLLAAVLAASGSFALAADYYIVVPNPAKAKVVELPPADPIVVTLATGSLPKAKINRPYSTSLTGFLSVTGDPDYTGAGVGWSLGALGALPAGLTLGADGTISGTPTVLSSGEGESFETVATYKTKSGQQVYTIKVGEAVLDVVQIAAGASHTCAITPVGGVKCWGINNSGQLGTGATGSTYLPVDAIGLSSGVVGISAGLTFSCAVLAVGTVKCWGANNSGQLGDGTTTIRYTPTDVLVAPGGAALSGVAQVSLSAFTACVLMQDSTAKCWGLGTNGQLGNGVKATASSPVSVSGLTGISKIVPGTYHTCAMLNNGSALCWGYNAQGQLGDGSSSEKLSPNSVKAEGGVGFLTGVSDIVAGAYHTCAVAAGGRVVCWGQGVQGQLGVSPTFSSNYSTPLLAQGLTSGMVSVSAGQYSTCAVSAAGDMSCWGQDNSYLASKVPVAMPVSGVARAAKADAHTCVMLQDGAAKCWGANNYGQVGDGTNTARPTPVNVRD